MMPARLAALSPKPAGKQAYLPAFSPASRHLPQMP